MLEKLSIVIVTYHRQELLAQLFDSICQLPYNPWRIVLVDNENSEETCALCSDYESRMLSQWQCGEGDFSLLYCPQEENLGGAGGFSVGIATAMELGAAWIWVMDDDVAVVPTAFENFEKLGRDYAAVVGNRIDYDGKTVRAPYWLSTRTGVANPFKRNPFKRAHSVGGIATKPTNMLCFEGSLISGDVARQVGPPDARYFIYWDDITYGYLVSKVGTAIRADFDVVRRTRDTGSLQVGQISMDDINDTKRFYMLRNRGMLGQYFKLHGDYSAVLFAVGNAIVFCEELFRLVVQRGVSADALDALGKGWHAMRDVLRDRSWTPYIEQWKTRG